MRDAETGRSVLSFHGHDGDVNQVAFSSDGSRLASTGDDGELKVWDPSSGRLLAGLSGSGSAFGASFSADGSHVAAAWDGKGRVRVLDLSTDRVVSSTRVDGVIDTALSPDGKRIAVASESGTSAVFDVETGERVFRLSRGDSEDVSWSPDGRYVAVTFDQGTRVWEAGTGRLRHTLLGHAGRVLSVAWGPDSARLVTGGADGIAKVWEIGVKGARELWSLSALGTRSGVQGLTFSPDGSRVMAGDLNVSTVTIWNLGSNGDAEWAHVPSRGEYPVPARFLPDGRRVAAISRSGGGKAVTIWDLSGREVETIAAATDDFSLNRLAVHPDGLSVAVGGWVDGDGRRFGGEVVRVWDLATERELFRIWHRLDVNEVSYRPDGDYLATASWDGTAKIIDSSGRVIRVLQAGIAGRDSNVSDVAFSPDGRLLATTVFTYEGSWEGRVKIWDWERGELVRTITSDVSVAGVPVSVQFDPTGSRIATAGDNGLVVIWDVKSGSRVAVLFGGQGGVAEAAFSPDGARVATARSDGTVRLSDADTGAEQLVLRGSGCEVWGVAFSPDGKKLASTSCDGVRIWALDIDDLLEIAQQEATRSLTDAECFQYLHVEECPASI
jgi:WD40 repeat protein